MSAVKIVRGINGGFWFKIGRWVYHAELTPYKEIPIIWAEE